MPWCWTSATNTALQHSPATQPAVFFFPAPAPLSFPPCLQSGMVRALVLDKSFLDYNAAKSCDLLVVGEQFDMVSHS